MAWPQIGTVNATAGLNIRSGPGTSNAVLTAMPHGAKPQVTGPGQMVAGTMWYPVTYNGKTGWASGQYLSGITNTPGTPTTPPVGTPSTPPEPAPIPHTQAGSNPFLSPGSTYGSHQNWYNTPIVKDQLSPKLPAAEWERAISQQGYGGNTRQASIARDLYSRAELGYQGATLQNPNLSFRDYVTTLGPNFIRDQLAGMTDAQKGVQYGAYSPRVRWVTR